MSKYFEPYETECKCGCGANAMNPILMQKLDELRELCGEPLTLNSAFRCEAHNEECGGVKGSQHTLGNAADIDLPDDMDIEELAENAREVGFDGIGIYYEQDFVHVDVRDDGESPAEYEWTDED